MNDNEITIGSDPEFVIMCGDSVSNALEIFSKVFEKDLSCIELIEPDEDDLIEVYNQNPAHYLNNWLNDADINYLIDNHKNIAAKQFVELFDYYGYEIKDILNNDIVEKDLLQISQKISKQILKQYLDEVISSNETYLKQLIISLFKNIDIKIIYKILVEKRKITYNDFIINSILEYYSKKRDFAINEFPNIMRKEILDNINENWEYDYDTDYNKYFCSAEIGCDGHSVIGEMRPKFGNAPIEHFNEILKLIKELSERLEPEIVCYDKELQVKAGTVQGLAYGEETILLGGHIHIGYDIKDKVYIDTKLSHILSVFVGIPLTLIEKPEEIVKRHKVYGIWEDTRPKEYGLEFRMPASWLVSPEITIGVLSLAYVVADEFIIGLHEKRKTSSIELMFDEHENYGKIYDKMLHEQFDVIDSYYYDELISISETLYENIKTMRLYPEYKEYIDYIFNIIENKEYWDSDGDILVAWSKLF